MINNENVINRPKKIIILSAMSQEMQALKENLNCKEEQSLFGLSFARGKFEEIELCLGITGVGKVQSAMVTQHLIDKEKPDLMLFTGVAGALAEDLDIGDILLGSELMQHDLDCRALGFERGQIPYTKERLFYSCPGLLQLAEQSICKHKLRRGRILTGDQFISHECEQDRRELMELGGDAIEMEGGSIAFVCHRNNLPFLVIRTISDRADGSAKQDFNRTLVEVAVNSCNVVMQVLRELNQNKVTTV